MGGLDSCDPAMLELFRAEMDTHVPVLSGGLLALESGGAGEKDLEAMMRAAHSIKGAARIVGIEAAVRVAHALEDCFSAAQGRRIRLGSEAVDVLLQGVDALQRICSPQPGEDVTEPSIQSLLDQLAAVKEGQGARPGCRDTDEPSIPPTVGPPATSAVIPAERRLTLPANLDESAAESLRAELSEALGQGVSGIRLDFSRVDHLTASGLSLFASLAREVARIDAPPAVEVEGVSSPVALLLRTSGLDAAFARRP